jgi:hypothetical protein
MKATLIALLFYIFISTQNFFMTGVKQLVNQLADARKVFLAEATAFSEISSKWKASPESW